MNEHRPLASLSSSARYWLPALLLCAALAAIVWSDSDSQPVAQRAEAEVEARPVEPPRPRAEEPPALRPAVFQAETVRNISFDDLAFEVEADQAYERSLLTREIEALDGSRVRIRGFMLPSYKAEGIQEFVLVRDNQVCCFGPGAKICHNMQVYMVEGASASYTTRVVEVTGRFTIDTWTGADGVVYSCYRLDASSVRGT